MESPRASDSGDLGASVSTEGRNEMNLEPNDLLLFARVVDEGSFSRAAERLGLPKSTVSRRVAALEAQLGERLLLRTTRKLTVTDFGLAVLEHAHHVVEDVAAAASLAQNRQIEPSGRLRVTMPGDLANLVLAPLLAEFVLRVSGHHARGRPLRTLRRSHRRELRRRDSHGRFARRRIACRPPRGRIHRQPLCRARVSRAPRNAVRAGGADGA